MGEGIRTLFSSTCVASSLNAPFLEVLTEALLAFMIVFFTGRHGQLIAEIDGREDSFTNRARGGD